MGFIIIDAHSHLWLKQDSVFRVYFLQSIVVAIGKTIILIEAYQVDRRKFFAIAPFP